MSENNIFIKIKNFIKNIFSTQKRLPTPQSTNIRQDLNKEQFLKLYDDLKSGEADLFSIHPDQMEKICMLLEEEIKLKQNQLDAKLAQISAMDTKIAQLKNSI